MPVNRLQQQLAGVDITQLLPLLPPSALGQLVQKKAVHEPFDLQEFAGIAGDNITVQGYVGLTTPIWSQQKYLPQLETSHTKKRLTD